MSQPKIELVCFDLGRVLMRITDDWSKAAALAGVTLPPGMLDEKTLQTIAEIGSRYDTGKITLAELAKEVGPLRGVAPRDVVRVVEAVLCGPYDDAAELMQDVVATGIRTACLSNTAEPHWGMMTDPADRNFLPLNDFTYRFASHLIGHRKPFAEIYEHVERVSGLSGASIAFFDDTLEHVEGARRRGWQARRIEHDGEPIRQLRAHLAEMHIF